MLIVIAVASPLLFGIPYLCALVAREKRPAKTAYEMLLGQIVAIFDPKDWCFPFHRWSQWEVFETMAGDPEGAGLNETRTCGCGAQQDRRLIL